MNKHFITIEKRKQKQNQIFPMKNNRRLSKNGDPIHMTSPKANSKIVRKSGTECLIEFRIKNTKNANKGSSKKFTHKSHALLPQDENHTTVNNQEELDLYNREPDSTEQHIGFSSNLVPLPNNNISERTNSMLSLKNITSVKDLLSANYNSSASVQQSHKNISEPIVKTDSNIFIKDRNKKLSSSTDTDVPPLMLQNYSVGVRDNQIYKGIDYYMERVNKIAKKREKMMEEHIIIKSLKERYSKYLKNCKSQPNNLLMR